MSESPRMSRLHDAFFKLHRYICDPGRPNTKESDALETVEHDSRVLFDTLRAIVAQGALTGPDTSTLEILNEFGIINIDTQHAEHASALTGILRDLSHPTKPQPFFDKYNTITHILAQHSLAATKLISTLLLTRHGLASPVQLDQAIDSYLVEADTWLLKDES